MPRIRQTITVTIEKCISCVNRLCGLVYGYNRTYVLHKLQKVTSNFFSCEHISLDYKFNSAEFVEYLFLLIYSQSNEVEGLQEGLTTGKASGLFLHLLFEIFNSYLPTDQQISSSKIIGHNAQQDVYKNIGLDPSKVKDRDAPNRGQIDAISELLWSKPVGLPGFYFYDIDIRAGGLTVDSGKNAAYKQHISDKGLTFYQNIRRRDSVEKSASPVDGSNFANQPANSYVGDLRNRGTTKLKEILNRRNSLLSSSRKQAQLIHKKRGMTRAISKQSPLSASPPLVGSEPAPPSQYRTTKLIHFSSKGHVVCPQTVATHRNLIARNSYKTVTYRAGFCKGRMPAKRYCAGNVRPFPLGNDDILTLEQTSFLGDWVVKFRRQLQYVGWKRKVANLRTYNGYTCIIGSCSDIVCNFADGLKTVLYMIPNLSSYVSSVYKEWGSFSDIFSLLHSQALYMNHHLDRQQGWLTKVERSVRCLSVEYDNIFKTNRFLDSVFAIIEHVYMDLQYALLFVIEKIENRLAAVCYSCAEYRSPQCIPYIIQLYNFQQKLSKVVAFANKVDNVSITFRVEATSLKIRELMSPLPVCYK